MQVASRIKKPIISSSLGGFTLLEVLAALLVLSIGVMGVLRAQTLSLRVSQQSLSRSNALLLATSVLDSIRGNRDAARAYVAVLPLADLTSPKEVQCEGDSATAPGDCDALTRAQQDLEAWSRVLTGSSGISGSKSVGAPIPDAAMEIAEVSGRFTVQIDWTEQGPASSMATSDRGVSTGSKRVLTLSAAIPL